MQLISLLSPDCKLVRGGASAVTSRHPEETIKISCGSNTVFRPGLGSLPSLSLISRSCFYNSTVQIKPWCQTSVSQNIFKKLLFCCKWRMGSRLLIGQQSVKVWSFSADPWCDVGCDKMKKHNLPVCNKIYLSRGLLHLSKWKCRQLPAPTIYI